MSDDRDDDLPGGAEAEAAEYALGILPASEMADFEARMEAEPELAQDVDAWTEYFSALTDSMPARTPPARVLKRIEQAVHGAPRPAAWRQLLPYLVGAIGGAGLSWAVMVSGVLVNMPGFLPSPELYAELAPVAGDLAFSVRIDPPTHTVALDLTGGTPPEGRALEVWLIPVGSAPISLGVMTAEASLIVRLPDLLAERVPGATLAVSDEPEGGSPTGAPTGAVQSAGIPIPL